jgi:hypothetical protein
VIICSTNTTFFTLLTPGRLAFGLVLAQVDRNLEMVDRNLEMVDQYKEAGRPVWSNTEFKAFL